MVQLIRAEITRQAVARRLTLFWTCVNVVQICFIKVTHPDTEMMSHLVGQFGGLLLWAHPCACVLVHHDTS